MFDIEPNPHEANTGNTKVTSQPLCRQGCGAVISAEQLTSHIQTECPMTLVPCPVSCGTKGCLEMIPRSRLESHLSTSLVAHFSTMVGFLHSKDREVIELRAKIDELAKTNQVLREEMYEIKSSLNAMKMGQHDNSPEQTLFHGHYRKIPLEGHMRAVTSIFIDDRILLTGSLDGTARIWNTLTQENLKCLEGHSGPIRAVAMVNDLIATGSQDDSIKLWDFETGCCIETLTGHKSTISSLAFHSSKVLVSASWDQTIKVWTLLPGQGWICSKSTEQCESRILCMDLSADLFVTGMESGLIYLWDINGHSTHPIKTFHGHDGPILSVQIQGPSLVSGGHDGSLRIWDVSSGEMVRSLKVNEGCITALRVFGSTLVLGGYDRSISLWDLLTGHPIRKIEEHQYAVTALAMTGNMIISAANDDRLIIWEFEALE